MLLLLILFAVMSFIVETKNSIQAEGTWPYDISMAYSNTYNKGQVRAGDTATLTLGHLEGIQVDRVELAMRANKSSGAGTVIVQADQAVIAQKEVTYNDVPATVIAFEGTQKNVDKLVVQVVGTQNSMYVDTFRVIYDSQRTAHTVTCMAGNEVYAIIKEASPGAGINLPYPDAPYPWQFYAWSKNEFWEESVLVQENIVPHGTKYYPKEDLTLWAVYAQDITPGIPYVTDLYDGEFMYVNKDTHLALTGIPQNGKMEVAEEDVYNAQQVYSIDFQGADTAYITHFETDMPIGYSGTKLTTQRSPWNVYHNGEETAFYTMYNGLTYVLWLNILDANESYYAGLVAGTLGGTALRLRTLDMPERLFTYTCHPEAQDIEQVKEEPTTGEWIIPFGPYRLIIKEGKKRLELW